MTSSAIPIETTTREARRCELAAEVLRSFGKLRLRAMGSSMLPAIRPGDIVSVTSHDAVEALPGDVVVFLRAGGLVIHRLVERSAGAGGISWLTRGDSVGGNDAPVSRHEILGRVTAIERGSRRFLPRPSAASRLASWVLCRSEFATRALLWCYRRKESALRFRDLGSGNWGRVARFFARS